MVITDVYADGGVILKNPSSIGGTWAWCHVDEKQEIVASSSGICKAEFWQMAITNNFTEMYAVTEAMVALPDGWSGRLYSDSRITLGRLFWNYKKDWQGIPIILRDYAHMQLRRLGHIKAIHLDGHPTPDQLAAGIGKRGNPCSKFNVWCDEACGKAGRDYRQSLVIEKEEGNMSELSKEELIKHIHTLRVAVGIAESTFTAYEEKHWRKGTAAGNVKAEANRKLAEQMKEALEKTKCLS